MIPAFTVAAFLRSIDSVTRAVPVCVTVEKQTFLGAFYTQNNPYTERMDAVQRGLKKPGDPYLSRSFYLLGEVPRVWRKAGQNKDGESKLVFVYDGEDWYAGGGYTPWLCRPYSANFISSFDGRDLHDFHPFGYWFHIRQWPTHELTPGGTPFGPIDQYDEKSRPRCLLTVEQLADD